MNFKTPTTRLQISTVLGWLILVGIVVLLGIFAVKAGMFAFLATERSEPELRKPLADQVTSGRSTITGFDKDRQPYKLSANSVLQDRINTNIIHLNTIAGVLSRNDGSQLNVWADRGQYVVDKKVLKMRENVKLSALNQFTAYLEKATVTLKERRLHANVPVTVIFDRGSIRAHGINVTENGKKISFFGGVKTEFEGEGSVVSSDKANKKKEN